MIAAKLKLPIPFLVIRESSRIVFAVFFTIPKFIPFSLSPIVTVHEIRVVLFKISGMISMNLESKVVPILRKSIPFFLQNFSKRLAILIKSSLLILFKYSSQDWVDSLTLCTSKPLDSKCFLALFKKLAAECKFESSKGSSKLIPEVIVLIFIEPSFLNL